MDNQIIKASNGMEIRVDGNVRMDATFEATLFTPTDLMWIENVLYMPREEEMIARRLLKLNTNYPEFANEIGYDYYQREGSAKILSLDSPDVDFVKEKGGRVLQNVYPIGTGIRYTLPERMAYMSKKASSSIVGGSGKGPIVSLDTLRVAHARRFIYETENKLTFVGDSNYGIKGLFDSSWYDSGVSAGTKERVASGVSGYTWAVKTPQEIINDLITGMSAVEKDNLFKPRVLVLPPAQYSRLRQPYSNLNPTPTLEWIQQQLSFEQIIVSRVMRKDNNGDGSYDYFMICDNDPEVMQLAIIQDINMGMPIYNIRQDMEMLVSERFGGLICRHPAGLYIGWDI